MTIHPENEPLELFVYPSGIAVLWREGDRYRVYHSGDVVSDSADEAEALDAFDALCGSLESEILDLMPRLAMTA